MDNFECYESAVESYRQALREALKPKEAKDKIEALDELLAVAKTVGENEARARDWSARGES